MVNTSGQTEGHDEAHRQAPSATTLKNAPKNYSNAVSADDDNNVDSDENDDEN